MSLVKKEQTNKLTKEQKKARKELFKLVKKKRTDPMEILKILDESDLSITVTNQIDESLFENSIKSTNNFTLLKWLYENGCNEKKHIENGFYNLFFMCPKKNIEDIFRWLMSLDVKMQDPHISTFTETGKFFYYMGFLNYGHIKSKVPLFLEYMNENFDACTQDNDGNTYLHKISLRHRDYPDEIMSQIDPFSEKYVFKNKVDVNLQNNDGDTAFHLLFRTTCNGQFGFISRGHRGINFIKNFPKNSETLGIKNSNGKTALDILCDYCVDFMNPSASGLYYGTVMDYITWFCELLKYLNYDFETDSMKFMAFKKKEEETKTKSDTCKTRVRVKLKRAVKKRAV